MFTSLLKQIHNTNLFLNEVITVVVMMVVAFISTLDNTLLIVIKYSQYIFVRIAIIALVIAYFLKSKSIYKDSVLVV